MENQAKSKQFISLRLKWAFGTAVGSLLIFIVVTMALFMTFTQSLFRQERSLLNQGMTNISQQLAKSDRPLTKQGIVTIIDPDQDNSLVQGADYQRPVIKELSDRHLIVNVYNPQGKNLLSTGRPDVRPALVNDRQVRIYKGAHHQILVGHMPIYSQKSRQVIGYLQVENNLNTYVNSYRQLRIVCILALCLVVLASGLLGYFLSFFFLQPLSGIHDTVKAISKDPTKDIRVPVVKRNDELAELI